MNFQRSEISSTYSLVTYQYILYYKYLPKSSSRWHKLNLKSKVEFFRVSLTNPVCTYTLKLKCALVGFQTFYNIYQHICEQLNVYVGTISLI
jgi:hypothetical protein